MYQDRTWTDPRYSYSTEVGQGCRLSVLGERVDVRKHQVEQDEGVTPGDRPGGITRFDSSRHTCPGYHIRSGVGS